VRLDLSIKELCLITGARFVDKTASQAYYIDIILIDSRSPMIAPNTLFVVIKGNKTHGSLYVQDFINKGGKTILTEQEIPALCVNQLVVENGLFALQQIAQYHRKKFQIPVIGITGSNGKTIVKEWLYHVLKYDFLIVRSPKSYNSQIGVALSVLEMDHNHTLAIFEAGISKPNEMANLQAMILPTIGVFTGIGDAHNSGFSSDHPEIEKKREKFVLFKEVEKLIEWRENNLYLKNNTETIEIKIEQINQHLRIQFPEKTYSFEIPFHDHASVSNCASVILAAELLGISPERIGEQLRRLPSISMRLEKMIGKNGNILINDVYNLDQKSLEIGIQYQQLNKENLQTAIFIAEDPLTVTIETSLLNTLTNLIKQVSVDQIVYFGNEEIGNKFTLVTKTYPDVASFSKDPFDLDDTCILFTGSRTSKLEEVVTNYLDRKHITQLVVNLAVMRRNLNLFRSKLKENTSVLAMVKAQSYGGGILEVAKFLAQENVAYFGVAYADEGVVLRKGGIKLPILVMNPEPAAFDDLIDYELEPSIYSSALLDQFIHQLILRQKTHFPIHIKLDTGMNRLGFREDELPDLVAQLTTQPEVYVRTVFSHFSAADELNQKAYTDRQLDQFKSMTNFIQQEIGYSFKRHISNSAGAYHYPEAHFDMVRLGIGLFGLLENHFPILGLENVLELRTQFSQIRKIEPGESVGYARNYKAEKPTYIGVIPVGYADGLRRSLGNGNWSVVVKDKKYPIIGNVCMDMCMVELGDDFYRAETEVSIFSTKNSVFEMSRILNTIPYEIISTISTRVQRVYVEE
jgi:alanine racemase